MSTFQQMFIFGWTIPLKDKQMKVEKDTNVSDGEFAHAEDSVCSDVVLTALNGADKRGVFTQQRAGQLGP